MLLQCVSKPRKLCYDDNPRFHGGGLGGGGWGGGQTDYMIDRREREEGINTLNYCLSHISHGNNCFCLHCCQLLPRFTASFTSGDSAAGGKLGRH